MDVSTYPTSTFELTSPIQVASLPAEGEQVNVKATGDLTLRGKTRPVTFDLAAQRTGSSIRASGTIPIVFEEWGIPIRASGRPTLRTMANWSSCSCSRGDAGPEGTSQLMSRTLTGDSKVAVAR
jgi:hypothetical protein